MAVFKVEVTKSYTVMSNYHLRDKNLSLKAKGLLSQMLSLPEDWDYTLKGLALINREKIDAIREAVRELEQAGYHNTLMLLKNYRNIVWLMKCFPGAIAAELDQPFQNLDKLIDGVDIEMAIGNKKLENRVEGIKKSRLLIDRVNEALTVLKKKPENGELLYELLYLTYINPNKTDFKTIP